MATSTRARGIHYIERDWGDETVGAPARWLLYVDGRRVATALIGPHEEAPPFSLTEGRRFTPQYHSATSALLNEPDSFIWRRPKRPPLFWWFMAPAFACLSVAVVWPWALLAAIVLILGAVGWETL